MAYPTPSVATVIRIRFAKTTNLFVAFTVNEIGGYSDAVAVSVILDVYAAMLLPFTIGDPSVFVPTLHQDLRNAQRVKA
jgi:hypothetical protein